MNFLIIGPGAMGCLFAARLNHAGFDVALLDNNKQRSEKINQQGILVEGVSGKFTETVKVITNCKFLKPDFVLFCVKSNNTKEAALKLKSCLPDTTSIVTLQNGLGNIEILKKIFGEKRVFGGVSAEGATMLDWGKIRHAGQGVTIIGPQGGRESQSKNIQQAFNNAGFKTELSDNIDSLIWGKLIVNVGINALTALTGLKNGELLKHKGILTIMEPAIKEAVEIANVKDIKIPYSNPIDHVKDVCNKTAENISSMLQDVKNKKTTEIDFINGAISEQGKIFNIPTPVNNTLAHLVHTIQDNY